MFNLLRLWVKRDMVREITASPSRPPCSTEDARMVAWEQLAGEIRAQGSGADFGAASIQAYMPKPAAPPRPKRPPAAIKQSEE